MRGVLGSSPRLCDELSGLGTVHDVSISPMNWRKISLSALTGVGLLVVAGIVWAIFTLPSFEELQEKTAGSNRVLLDQKGRVLQETRTDLAKRRLVWISLDGFSKPTRDTIVFAEDKNFFKHFGIDFFALFRAMDSTLRKKRIQGASTISMQTSDLIDEDVLLNNQLIQKGSIPTKIRQVIRGVALDLIWSKQQILEAYLNLVHLRGETQGVHSFSELYLGKAPLFVNTAESAVIAAMIPGPNRSQNRLEARACELLQKYKNDAQCALLEKPMARIFSGPKRLEQNKSQAPHLAQRLFESHPAKFFQTSIDHNLQKDVYAILEKNLASLQIKNAHDMAAIVIENKSGKVLAYVGTIDRYSNAKHVDGVNSPRQAGSTLKPFLYGRAIEKKLITASSLIEDVSTSIQWEGGLYRPVNYDSKFNGTVSVRQALASSLNVPAVKIIRMLKLTESLEVIQSLNFSNVGATDNYGASIALGAIEVKLIELTNAYRAIANGGEMTPVVLSQTPFIEVGLPRKVMSEQTAFILKSILSDPNARKIGFPWGSPLETPMWTAVKTGTSKGLRDNWCVGFSSKYTVGVWTGNFDASLMQKVSGVSGAGPSWNEIMRRLHRNTPSHEPKPPRGIVSKQINIHNKTGSITEYYIDGTEPMKNKIKKATIVDLKIQFPADGSTLTLNPQKNQNSVDIILQHTGHVPEGSLLKYGNLNVKKENGRFIVRSVERGQHLFQILGPKGELLAETQFTLL